MRCKAVGSAERQRGFSLVACVLPGRQTARSPEVRVGSSRSERDLLRPAKGQSFSRDLHIEKRASPASARPPQVPKPNGRMSSQPATVLLAVSGAAARNSRSELSDLGGGRNGRRLFVLLFPHGWDRYFITDPWTFGSSLLLGALR